jgi:hypothetical protein
MDGEAFSLFNKNIYSVRARPERKADNLTAVCEPIV